MKRAYLIGWIVLAAVSNAFAYDTQVDEKNWGRWTACSIDEECVAIHDACGGWTAVNSQFKAEGEDYQDELASVADCRAIANMEPDPKVLCLDQVCSVKPDVLGSTVNSGR